MDDSGTDTLLEVEDLRKHYPISRGMFKRVAGLIKAVDGVSFDIRRGETLALVGESGCGKTTTGRCIMHAIDPTSGSVRFRAEDEMVELATRSGSELREIWKHMGMIFQDPYSSLNPRMTVLQTVGEPFVDQDDSGILMEQEHLLAAIDPPRPVIFRSNHASNCLALAGNLPRDRDRLLAEIAAASTDIAPLRPWFLRGR